MGTKVNKKEKKHFKKVEILDFKIQVGKRKKKTKKVKLYGYLKTGVYLREKLGDRRGCSNQYRMKKIKDGVYVLICIRKGEGKRGGKTKALSLLRYLGRDLRHYCNKGKKDKYYKMICLGLKKARKITNFDK